MWWVIAVSTFNGKVHDAITFQGTRQDAQSNAVNGIILAGPFKTEAGARVWGLAWSAKNHLSFTDNPGASSGNPVTGTGAFFGEVGNSAVNVAKDIPGVGSIDDLINSFKNNFEHIILRVGEIAVGMILLYIGLKAMATPEGKQVGLRTVKSTIRSADRAIARRRAIK